MLPSGTTSGQLGAAARWALVAVVGAGALGGWWPGAASWGSLAGGVVIVLVLWLMAKTACGDRAAPAGLFHLALAGPAVILAAHFLRHMQAQGEAYRGDRGALDISTVYQFALIALSAMIVQDLFASPRARGVPALLAGAGMIVGALAGAFRGQADLVRWPLGLLAFCGAGLLLSILYSRPFRPPRGAALRPEGGAGPSRPHVMHAAAVAAVAALGGALLLLFPRPGLLAAALLAAMVILGAVFLGGWRHRAAAIAFLALLVLVAALVPGIRGHLPQLPQLSKVSPNFGVGEAAYATLTASTTGLEFLGGQVGWAGLAWLGAGLGGAVVLALWRARGTGEGAATVFRLWSAGLAMAAFLSPQGLFVPSASLAVAFTWGFLAAPAARPAHRWSGWALLGALGAVMLLLALAPDVGLLEWSCARAGLHDDFLHVICGLLFALLLAWQMGRARVWRGLVAIGLAAAAGAAGELLQTLTATRSAEWRDLILHCVGCAAGAVPYLLARGAGMCEGSS